MFLYRVVQTISKKLGHIKQEEKFPQDRRKESKKLEGLKMTGRIQSTAASPTTMPDPGSSLRPFIHSPVIMLSSCISYFVKLQGTVNLPLRTSITYRYVNKGGSIGYQSVLY
jgi:hypothetical protein